MPQYLLDILINAEDKASANIGRVDQSTGRLGSTLSGFGPIALGAAGAAVGLGAAIVGAGVHFTNLASDIDTAGDKARTTLGLTADEAEQFEGTMKAVFANNFGENFDDIGAALVEVNQQFERLGGPENQAQLQSVTERAFAVRDAFDLGVNESTSAAITLMENFGLTSDQAFGFVTRGIQRGLNSSGDFIDTIGEYSNQFADSGFNAEQFFSILETGNAGGVLGTDKIADAVKEMSIRFLEGGDDVRAAFDDIGLSFDQVQGSITAGDESFADYFQNVINGLAAMEDPFERNRAGIALFGTQWEDITATVLLGVDSQKTGMEDIESGVEDLDKQYDNFKSMWEQNSRAITVALLPIGEGLLKIAEEHMPAITTFVTETLAPAILNWTTEGVEAIGDLSDSVTELGALGAWTTILGWFGVEEQAARDWLAELNKIRDWFIWAETNLNAINDAVNQAGLNVNQGFRMIGGALQQGLEGFTGQAYGGALANPVPAVPSQSDLAIVNPSNRIWSQVDSAPPVTINVNMQIGSYAAARDGAQIGVNTALGARGN